MLRTLMVFALLSGGLGAALSAQVDSTRLVVPRAFDAGYEVSLENDSPLGGGDNRYTNGLRLTGFSNDLTSPLHHILLQIHGLGFAGGGDTIATRRWTTIAHTEHTPDTLEVFTQPQNARPYAGHLFAEIGGQRVTEVNPVLDGSDFFSFVRTEAGIALGTMGSWAFGENPQAGYHAVSQSRDPKGWERGQRDVTVTLMGRYRTGMAFGASPWQVRSPQGAWETFLSGLSAFVEPQIQGFVGSPYTAFEYGGNAAFGYNLTRTTPLQIEMLAPAENAEDLERLFEDAPLDVQLEILRLAGERLGTADLLPGSVPSLEDVALDATPRGSPSLATASLGITFGYHQRHLAHNAFLDGDDMSGPGYAPRRDSFRDWYWGIDAWYGPWGFAFKRMRRSEELGDPEFARPKRFDNFTLSYRPTRGGIRWEESGSLVSKIIRSVSLGGALGAGRVTAPGAARPAGPETESHMMRIMVGARPAFLGPSFEDVTITLLDITASGIFVSDEPESADSYRDTFVSSGGLVTPGIRYMRDLGFFRAEVGVSFPTGSRSEQHCWLNGDLHGDAPCGSSEEGGYESESGDRGITLSGFLGVPLSESFAAGVDFAATRFDTSHGTNQVRTIGVGVRWMPRYPY